jgi:hypothetical protein
MGGEINMKVLSVVAVKTVPSAKPKESAAVLEHHVNGTVA